MGVSLPRSRPSCNAQYMSEQTNSSPDPQWDVADRMRKALRTGDVGVQEMADYLGVARNTVSTWINGRITPSKQTLRLWSLRCGVRYEWLTGDALRPQDALTGGDAGAEFRCIPPLRQRTRRRRVHRPVPQMAQIIPIGYAS